MLPSYASKVNAENENINTDQSLSMGRPLGYKMYV